MSRLDVRSDLESSNLDSESHDLSRANPSASVTPQTNKGKAANLPKGVVASSISSDFDRGDPSSNQSMFDRAPQESDSQSNFEFYREDVSELGKVSIISPTTKPEE